MMKGRRWSGVFLITSLAVVPVPGRLVREGGTQMVATVDETAIRKVVQDEVAAWNRGDATAYSSQFANDGTFTNIRGQFFTGHEAFLKQHEVIFQGIFKNTTLQQDIVSLRSSDLMWPSSRLLRHSAVWQRRHRARLPTAKGVCARACCKSSRDRVGNGRSSRITT
jgi:hypothetical protein